ncbi:MAG TPA: CopG family transcriptional regulator [Phycisphaerae bacterium]|nr:CopG family transcriptional regulator [Phycisphaerae bacterium]
MPQQKQSIVTFKAEESLVDALQGIPNRSAFIRSAVLAALDSTCPLCGGTGILSQEQKKHWDAFAMDHAVAECGTCHEWHLVCSQQSPKPAHETSRKPNRKPRKRGEQR